MRVLSLCSGIGGIDLAAEWAGMTIVGQAEIDPFCREVLTHHWPDVPNLGDINDLASGAVSLPDAIDLVAGGIPCQPWSVAGTRRGAADDRDLWPQTLSIIRRARPSWVLIENVAHFATMALDRVSADLETEGYEVQAYVIPACAVDAPHRRERIFIVAYSGHKQPSGRLEAEGRGEGQTRYESSSRRLADAAGLQFAGQQPAGDHQARHRGEGDVPGEGVADTQEQPERTGLRPGEPGGKRGRRPGDGGSEGSLANAEFEGLEGAAPRSDHWDGAVIREDGRRVKPGLRLLASRVPRRVAKLRALGNAVVPQQVAPILEAIAEIEAGRLA